MNRAKVTIGLLAMALVVSNAWWAYLLIDAGVTATYMRVSFDDNSQALKQTLALLPVVAKPGHSRADVLAAAAVPDKSIEPFEKEGLVFVGQLGLKFDEHGRFVEAVAGF